MFTQRNYLVGIIIFVGVWALVLAVPQTRNILRSQIEESKSRQQYLYLFQPFENDSFSIRDTQKYMEFSNDPAVKMTLWLNQQTLHVATPAKMIKQYDRLLKQHPKNVWLIKERLIASIPYNIKLPINSTSYKRIYPNPISNLSKAENQQFQREITSALQIALYGEKLDPENSFFNWIQATLLFAQHKPELALQALEKGAHKKYFDDGFGESRRAAVIASEIAGRNLFEERFLANYSVFIGNDVFLLSETNRAAVWQGALAEQRGDQQQALKIYGTQLQLCQQVLSYTQKFGYTSFVNNLALNAWLSTTRSPAWREQTPKASPGEDKPYLVRRNWIIWRTTAAANFFADYAAANHRPDLSVMAKKLGNALFVAAGQPLHAQTDDEVNALFGRIQMKILFQLKWIGMQLFNCLELLVPLFLIVSLPVLWVLRNHPNIRSTVDKQITSVNVISGALFVVCIFGFLLAFMLLQGVSSYYYNNFTPLVSAQMDHEGILQRYIGIYYWWIPFAACYAYCAISTLWKCRKSTFVSEMQETLSLAIGEEKLKKISHRISIAHQVVWWIIIALLELFWCAWIVTTDLSYILIPLTLIIAIIIWWFAKNIHLPAPALFTGTYWLLFATWLQRSLAILVLVGTLTYGITSWASLPLRNNANKQLDHILKVGEVAALREAVANTATP